MNEIRRKLGIAFTLIALLAGCAPSAPTPTPPTYWPTTGWRRAAPEEQGMDSENLVVVFTADLPFTNDADLIPLQELLDQYILPAVKSDKSLPANPNSLARFTAGIQALAQPQRTTPAPLPAIAAEISGKTYTLEDNPFGWHTLSFSFQDGADEAKVTVDGTQQVAVGLDNVYRTFGSQDDTFPQGFRGYWDQDTFVVESIVLSPTMQTTSRIQFPGDAIHITWADKGSGSTVEVEGK